MFVLPDHDPCGGAGLGEVQRDGVATCVVRREWAIDHRHGGTAAHDSEGCGAKFPLCAHGLMWCLSCHPKRRGAAA
jgi:hypothetical protein